MEEDQAKNITLIADKLGSLLETKYGSVQDGVSQLGPIPDIRNTFIDFQRHLYQV